MPFPVSASGRTEVDCAPEARVSLRRMLEGVSLMLAEEGAHEVRLAVNRISFKGGSRGASGLLKPVAEGEVELSQFSNTVVAEHRLSFKKGNVLFSTAIAAGLVGFELYRGRLAENWLFPAIAIVWLLGGSYFGPALKFPRALRRVILAAGEREEPAAGAARAEEAYEESPEPEEQDFETEDTQQDQGER